MKVKELLNSAEKWTKGEMARNNNEKYVGVKAKSAEKFCLLGAIYKCYPKKEAKNIIMKIAPTFNSGESTEHIYECEEIIFSWNDRKSRKFKDVQKLVNKLNI